MRLTIVDVFAKAPLQGNQLAVIRDAAGLETAAMQSIAREMNFSETTFVSDEQAGRATVRIFTPSNELPFAGHPTLGTAWVLASGREVYVLSLGVGDVPVRFTDECVWMTPPAVSIGAPIRPAVAAGLIGLKEQDMDPAYGACHVECGPRFKLIFVRTLDCLRRVRVEHENVRDEACFVVCEQGLSAESQLTARMFFSDGTALREDPATGSANSALAAYFRGRGRSGRFVVDQGYEMGRPSRIYLDIGDELGVGGEVHAVAEGRLVF